MSQLALHTPSSVESVVPTRSNGQLLAAAAQLWITDDDVVVDVTYGRGRFWTKYRPRQLVAHDLALDGVDLRALPEAAESVDVVVLDPPYIVQGTYDKSTLGEFQNRYGLEATAPQTVPELKALFRAGISEGFRVLRPGGRLLVKCMDFVAHSRYQAFHPWVVAWAEEAGFRVADTLIHYSGVGATSPTQVQTQRTSRRAHSVLLVFEKKGRRP